MTRSIEARSTVRSDSEGQPQKHHIVVVGGGAGGLSTFYSNVRNQYNGSALVVFRYQDYGSLVSLSEFSTVGNLMGNLMKGSLFIEGWLARIVYRMLYRKHQSAVHGLFVTGLIMIGDRIHRVTHSHLKLH